MKKRILALVLTTIVFLLGLTSCGGKHECFFCGEEKKCNTTEIFGEEVYVCSDCVKDFQSLA